ncbi:MAG TPA: aminopeptidase P family protein [Egibacteraceae bacterium]|nr:aminopeptidase P family protein [Egibacteraceae bacterium]
MHATRRTRLRGRLSDAELDALLVTKRVNVRYLTGFTGSVGALLVTAESAVLAVDDRYAEQAADEVADVELVVTRGDDWLRERGRGARLGLESHDLSWDRALALAGLLDARVEPAPAHVETLRQVKDAAELAALRRACAITDGAFAHLCGRLGPGLTEREVARLLHHTLTELGAHDQAFEAIVASGPHSARPHHRATDRRLAAGDVVKLDFGALVEGYHADMTRMVALGAPDPELERVFAVVRRAQEAGVAAVTDGVPAKTVDAACREHIAAAGYGERFPHGTGHGLGLEIHEAPVLRQEAGATLRAGMTVTVEPGVYLPGLGGVRIEDTVAVTGGSADVLTRSPRDLVRL